MRGVGGAGRVHDPLKGHSHYGFQLIVAIREFWLRVARYSCLSNEARDSGCFRQQVIKIQFKEEELVELAPQSFTSSEWKAGAMGREDGGGGAGMDVRRQPSTIHSSLKIQIVMLKYLLT